LAPFAFIVITSSLHKKIEMKILYTKLFHNNFYIIEYHDLSQGEACLHDFHIPCVYVKLMMKWKRVIYIYISHNEMRKSEARKSKYNFPKVITSKHLLFSSI
jgi:hypothetical protein